MKLISASITCCIILPALGGPNITITESQGAAPLDISQYIDALSVKARSSFGMELDNSQAEFDFSELSLTTFLSKPIQLGGDWSAIAYLDFRASQFDFDGNPLAGAFNDDLETNLYHIGIPFAIYHSTSGSRWTYGAWINPSISSDFDHLNSDDFFLDGAIATAYQVNDCLTIGFGVYASDVIEDPFVIPGAGFVWVPNEDWLVSYYGPRFVARRQINDRNQIGLEISTNGGNWNFDANNQSLKLNFRSWRSGLYYRYNITGELWLEAAAGYTFANKLELLDRDGSDPFGNLLGEAGGSPYAYIGMNVARW